MKKSIRVLCLVLAMAMFAFFAIGSGSEKASENKGADSAATGENENATEATEEEKAQYDVSKETVSVTTDSIGTKYVQVSWAVKNTGKVNLYLSSGSADIENSEGTLEDSVSMISAYPEVIKPGETAYYYERTLYDGSATSGLSVVTHSDVEKATVDCVRYEVSEVSVKDEQYLGAKVIGRVENTTDEDETMAEVAAILYDADKNLIGVEFTYIDGDLAAGDKKAFECSSLRTDLKAADIASYEVYAYPTQYQF